MIKDMIKEVLILVAGLTRENPVYGGERPTHYRIWKAQVLRELIHLDEFSQEQVVKWAVSTTAQAHSAICVPALFEEWRPQLFKLLKVESRGSHRKRARDGGGWIGTFTSEVTHAWLHKSRYEYNDLLIRVAGAYYCVGDADETLDPHHVVLSFLDLYSRQPAQDCSDCQGSGLCPECNGSVQSAQDCSDCQGSGLCPECNGSVQSAQDCSDCQGSGLCARCGGSGHED